MYIYVYVYMYIYVCVYVYNITHNVATGTKHTACSTEHSLLFRFTCFERSGPSLFIDNNLTLLLPTFGVPCMSIFGFLRRTSSYFHDMRLIVTRVTLTSIRHLGQDFLIKSSWVFCPVNAVRKSFFTNLSSESSFFN